MHLYKTKKNNLFGIICMIAIFISVICLFLFFTSKIEQTARDEGVSVLSDAIDRAVVNCYAIEGQYPPDLEYLIKNYGLQVDKDRYLVTYEIFANNVRPKIKIKEITG